MKNKDLVKRALVLYPQSKKMRKQWVRNTVHLYASGKHALITGGWKNGSA